MLQALYQDYRELHQHKYNRLIHIAMTFTIPYWIYLGTENHTVIAILGYILSNHALCFILGHSLEKNNREVLLHAKGITRSIQIILFFTLLSPLLRIKPCANTFFGISIPADNKNAGQ